jgi:hypothetical protein
LCFRTLIFDGAFGGTKYTVMILMLPQTNWVKWIKLRWRVNISGAKRRMSGRVGVELRALKMSWKIFSNKELKR